MCIIRSENDPRDEQDGCIAEFVSNINNSEGDLREAMQTVFEDLSGDEVLLVGKDKESFCETFMLRLKAEIDVMAAEQEKWRRE
jgi:hypothetical protein